VVEASIGRTLDSTPRRFGHGEVITRQGDPVSALSLVASGVVRLSAVTRAGREIVVGLLGPGQVFGEAALLPDGAQLGSLVEARAVGPAMIIEIPAATLRTVIEANPAMGEELLRLVAARLYRTSAALEEALAQDVPARVSRRLRQLALDHGDRHAAGGVRLRVPLTQDELARMVGASREAVNRSLGALASRGLVRTERRTFVIPDVDALERSERGNGSA
jgi:CRP/FNR family cyclic AMP-dependent transcriptional regulator